MRFRLVRTGLFEHPISLVLSDIYVCDAIRLVSAYAGANQTELFESTKTTGLSRRNIYRPEAKWRCLVLKNIYIVGIGHCRSRWHMRNRNIAIPTNPTIWPAPCIFI